ncbi:MAG: hypothetical protein FWG07_02240 [Treponema sp.]|nr:hypothetical protein [Treponema sp.]
MTNALSPAVLFRRRSGWEAADMGVLLWRTNCFPILFFMGIPLVILFAVSQITARLETNWLFHITLLVIWWLKPLLDRFCLHVVSIRFFEPHASFRRLFRGLGKTLKTGLAGDLLWRRLSPFRSARMPLRVLERLNGKNYKRRKLLLTRNGLGFGLPLTLICIGMIIALNIGELVFLNSIINMIRGENNNFLNFFSEENNIVSLLYFLNEILIETLYVTMGFSLYINSRVETEGWDIELLFKTCVEKNKKSYRFPDSINKAVLAIPVLILFLFFIPGPGFTSEPSIQPEWLKTTPVSEEAGKTLTKILEDPEFGTRKESRKIQFKQKNETRYRMPDISVSTIEEIMGKLLRFIVVAIVCATLGFGAFYAYRRRKRFFPARSSGKSNIDDPSREEYQTLLRQAEELHRKGKIREAWALCFRAFISVFTKLWFFPFPAEATEYESLAIVRKNYSVPALSNEENKANTPDFSGGIKSFEDFIRNWIIFAYGGQEPAAGSFEQAVVSCRILLENQRINE